MSWCVAQTMRVSTGIALRPPIRSITRSCRKRSSLTCSGSGTSPISSRNSVPPCACSILPSVVLTAPVNAPFSCPNSSLSSSVSGIAAQLIATNAPRRARLASCSPRASNSLPVPARAEQHHRHVGGGDALDRARDLQHLGRGGDHARRAPRRRSPRRPGGGSRPPARGRGTRARRSAPARRCRSAWRRNPRRRRRSRAARSRARRGPRRRSPWCRASARRISASVANPSVVPSGSGGRPRSSVTTAGSSARSSVDRLVAVAGDEHLIAVIGPAQLALQRRDRPRRSAGVLVGHAATLQRVRRARRAAITRKRRALALAARRPSMRAAHRLGQLPRLERADAEAAGLGRDERAEQLVADERRASCPRPRRSPSIATASPSRSTAIVTGSSAGLASIAFWTRWPSSCSSRAGSAERDSARRRRRRSTGCCARRAGATRATQRRERRPRAARSARARVMLRQAREQRVHPRRPNPAASRPCRRGIRDCRRGARHCARPGVSWLTRFLMSWMMNAKRRLNSSKRCASASASCARASAR